MIRESCCFFKVHPNSTYSFFQKPGRIVTNNKEIWVEVYGLTRTKDTALQGDGILPWYKELKEVRVSAQF